MEKRTAFFYNEKCFWHSGGEYVLTVPVGTPLVQPSVSGGLPENPETKRRFKNLMEVTGLLAELLVISDAPAATNDELELVHPSSYLQRFRELSEGSGGTMGHCASFARGGFDVAKLSCGLAVAAVRAVLSGRCQNAYALCRPPGHHCLPEQPQGFCLLANVAVAVEVALQLQFNHGKELRRVAVLDFDVHHGNGTERIFYDRANVLTVSLHQERNFPIDTGDFADRGSGKGLGCNLNVPLPPGAGHEAYLRAVRTLALPEMRAFDPDLVVVACGFDASGVDPLARMLARSETFRAITKDVVDFAEEREGRGPVFVHEGGYSEAHVPFCGHAVVQELARSQTGAEDPLDKRVRAHQPGEAQQKFFDDYIDSLRRLLDNEKSQKN